jgi:hypothetical protein
MSVFHWGLLVAVVGAVCVGRQLYLYPGGWVYAFRTEHHAAREDLRTHRERVRALESRDSQQVAAADAKVRSEQRKKRSAIRALEKERDRLRAPGRGPLLKTLSDLALHQHVLSVPSDDGSTESLQLDGLEVSDRPNSKRDEHWIIIAEPNGDERVFRYPYSQWEEATVYKFAASIRKAVKDHGVWTDERELRLAELEEELDQVEADNDRIEKAQRERNRLKAQQRANPQLKAARAELEQAFGRWEALTSHRPHR